ncbi:unnamed protein product [Linum trigynum]|uniref:Uncharacterized protein n=1 Tax=Linum trigynum TaxID=586398 RepID=A0AAV2GNL3_9ROSI
MESPNIRPLTVRNMKMSRLDSLTASQADFDAIMPSPRANGTMLIDLFAQYNLSGSHSIVKDRCFAIQFRLFARYDGGS